MLTSSVATPSRKRAQDNPIWNARLLTGRRDWRYTLPGHVADEFAAYLRAHPERAENLDLGDLDCEETPRLAEFGRGIQRGLLHGAGVAWVRGLAGLGFSPGEQRLFYMMLGVSMGRVMTEYGPIFCVRDRGGDYRKEAIPVSMTGAETGFHTDSSAVDTLPDLVGLLCEEPSREGGHSLISNAMHAYWHLRVSAPESLELLEQEFIRDVVTPGKERTEENLRRNRFPIFDGGPEGKGRTFRYMRYWIEQGHEKAGSPLTERERVALDVLDETLASPENVVRLHLERGEQLWVNNRRIAHGREGYADSPGNCRQLQRLWLETPEAGTGR